MGTGGAIIAAMGARGAVTAMMVGALLMVGSGCSGSTSAEGRRERTEPTPSATSPKPKESATPAASAPPPDPCGDGLVVRIVREEWTSLDHPVPETDEVLQEWRDADIEIALKNTSNYEITVSDVLYRHEATDLHPLSTYESFQQKKGVDATLSPGDEKTLVIPSIARDWADQFPLYSDTPPSVSIYPLWDYVDEKAHRRCVLRPERDLAVGESSEDAARVAVKSVRHEADSLVADIERCAGPDDDVVLDLSTFVLHAAEDTTVSGQYDRAKHPVAANTCRAERITFSPAPTDEDWWIEAPGSDKTPYRWRAS